MKRPDGPTVPHALARGQQGSERPGSGRLGDPPAAGSALPSGSGDRTSPATRPGSSFTGRPGSGSGTTTRELFSRAPWTTPRWPAGSERPPVASDPSTTSGSNFAGRPGSPGHDQDWRRSRDAPWDDPAMACGVGSDPPTPTTRRRRSEVELCRTTRLAGSRSPTIAPQVPAFWHRRGGLEWERGSNPNGGATSGPRSDSSWSRRPATRLTTTSTTRPRCGISMSSTGPPQPPCADHPLRPEQAATPTTARWYAFDGEARTTDRHPLPGQQWERRHVPRPPPARRLRHRHRAGGANKPVSLAETGRWRVPYAPGSGSFETGPTGGATMQQVELPVGFPAASDLERHPGRAPARSPAPSDDRPRTCNAPRAGGSFGPPATVDDTTKGNLDLVEQRRRHRVSLGRGANLGESLAWR